MEKPFQIMIKPTGASCNIACDYCYYLKKNALYSNAPSLRMSSQVLREFTRQYIQSQNNKEIVFAWQGGEPTLMGIEFFKEALAYQQEFKRPGQLISNTIQTNGIMLGKAWCNFLKENNFLVGLSMDGPQVVHDVFRKTKNGKETFNQVYRALQLLKEYQIAFNILCVVSRANAGRARQVYEFFRNEDVQFIQFISQTAAPDSHKKTFAATALEWGEFLCSVFDQWVRRDVGKVFVMNFEATLAAWVGTEQSTCIHRPNCGQTMVLEHNGDLYSCDFFVDEEHRLGNIMERDLAMLAVLPRQVDFGNQKSKIMPESCKSCHAYFFCNGGCPADRIATTEEGSEGNNYFCEGYKLYIDHTSSYMERMSSMLKFNIPVENVMNKIKTQC